MRTFIIPPPTSVYNAVMSDGAVIKLRRYGNPNGHQVFLSHGNGCAIDGYFPYWCLLLKKYDCIVFDFRNYGRNPVHEGKHCYEKFYEDMVMLFGIADSVFGKKRRAGIFHSMSARTNIKLALDDDCRLEGMVLFDPPMVPPITHSLHIEAGIQPKRINHPKIKQPVQKPKNASSDAKKANVAIK